MAGAVRFMLLGALLLLAGSYIGLFRAPREVYMGDVYRIMYVHVPVAWNMLLAFLFGVLCALAFLFKGDYKWDSRHEAALEVGVVLGSLVCVLGSIWAKPTWGVWWDWDPRLTSTAIMLVAFGGIIALRRFVDDPVKRATWSSSATVVASVNVPIVYFSVRWWNSLHQMQSSPETVSAPFLIPLRTNAFGVLFLMIGLITLRSRVAALRLEQELGPPLPAALTATVLAAGDAR
jgi:heme exporter protein C